MQTHLLLSETSSSWLHEASRPTSAPTWAYGVLHLALWLAGSHRIPAGDPLLPRGGKRLTLFEPTTKFPTLIITQDETAHEVEYYCFDRLQYPVRLDDDDFDPDKLWPTSKPQSTSPENALPKSSGNPLLKPY